jgi:acyl-CoA dehydrogenase
MAVTEESDRAEMHEMIRQTARDIAGQYDREYWRTHADNNEFPQEYWDDLADAGFLGTFVPEEYGGEGLGVQEMLIANEELTRAGASSGILFLLTPIFGALTLSKHGTEEQKEEYLPRIADGDLRWCMALTEPEAGTNSLEMNTFAEKEGDEYVVNGTKQWISGVNHAHGMLLIARTSEYDPENPTHGITMFIVPEPTEREGIELRPIDMALGEGIAKQFVVDFDDLRVHEDWIVGEEDLGSLIWFDTLNPERISTAASTVGDGLRAIDLATEYAGDRQVWSEPIGAHQGVQHPLAESYAQLMCAREMVYKAARKFDRGEDCAEETNIALLRASQAAHEAAHHAVQAHGGNGFTHEYEVFSLWVGTRVTQVAPANTQLLRNYIGEHVLGLPRSYERG